MNPQAAYLNDPEICTKEKLTLILQAVREYVIKTFLNGRPLQAGDDAILQDLLTEGLHFRRLMKRLHSLKFDDPRFSAIAVAQDGDVLRFVPTQSPDLCLLAVQRNWRTIQHVQERFLTNQLLFAALRQHRKALNIIRNKWPRRITPELLAYAAIFHPQLREDCDGNADLGKFLANLNEDDPYTWSAEGITIGPMVLNLNHLYVFRIKWLRIWAGMKWSKS